MGQTTTQLADLVEQAQATRGAVADMRDWLGELGFAAAQTASVTAVVRRVEQRFPGGVLEFLANYSD